MVMSDPPMALARYNTGPSQSNDGIYQTNTDYISRANTKRY